MIEVHPFSLSFFWFPSSICCNARMCVIERENVIEPASDVQCAANDNGNYATIGLQSRTKGKKGARERERKRTMTEIVSE